MAEKVRWRPAPMTGWFDPGVMARSAAMLLTANIFGRHSDTRLIEALGSQPQDVFDYRDRQGEFWLDYVADLGDGWNATYAVASAMAEESLLDTRAGDVLVMGGDEVYPYPSRNAYARRTETPYREAFAGRARKPDVFAIPGNHDWFDSLVAFSRAFCRPERGFAGCRTRQTRSYFALALPRDWWLLGVDLQLGADFDEPQLRYFHEVAARMGEQANIVLCVPEPQWVYEVTYPKYEAYTTRTLDYFCGDVLRRPVSVMLTGDLHFYRRYSDGEGRHRIIAGGGGAFLHPTHQPRTPKLQEGFTEQGCYPQKATSSRLAWGNLLFPFVNPKACLLPGLVYALSAWLASARLNLADVETLGQAFASSLRVAVRDPLCGLWLLSVIAGLVFFTDTHSRAYRILGGAAHALSHLFSALVLAWLAMRLTTGPLGMSYGDPLQLLLSGALVFLAGGLVGGLVIGVYLLVSINVFGRHGNEAFSSLRGQDCKHWLRLNIDEAGILTIRALGIDVVPRRWKEDAAGRPRADDPRASGVREIDRVSVRPRSWPRPAAPASHASPGLPASPNTGPGPRPSC
ncbi:MAG TPA: hypothetical protein VKO83_04840 [Steroidobacteraceae bacterium]|nr:hypothetical protein [Steroidobacteraceae bacterium]